MYGRRLWRRNGRGIWAVPSSFSPSQLPNLALWLRADLGVTTSGSNVTAWADQSGNARDFTQGTDALRPTLSTGSHGKPVLVFTGTMLSAARHLLGPAFGVPLAAGGEIFIVSKSDSDPPAAGGGGLYKFGTDSLVGTHIPFSNSQVFDDFGSSSRKTTGIDPGNHAAWHSYGVVSKANDWRAYFNGSQFYSTATNTIAWKATSTPLGCDLVAAWFLGQIAEVIVVAGEMSAANRAAVQSYAAERYAIV